MNYVAFTKLVSLFVFAFYTHNSRMKGAPVGESIVITLTFSLRVHDTLYICVSDNEMLRTVRDWNKVTM